jgi:hypothetical protein
MPPIVTEVTVKLTTPDPELLALKSPVKVAEKLSLPALGSPPGLVDEDTVARLWAALERAGKADTVRKALLEMTAVRR